MMHVDADQPKGAKVRLTDDYVLATGWNYRRGDRTHSVALGGEVITRPRTARDSRPAWSKNDLPVKYPEISVILRW